MATNVHIATNRQRLEELEQEVAFLRQAYFELLSVLGSHPELHGSIYQMVQKWEHFGCKPEKGK